MLSKKILTVFMSLVLVVNIATPIYGEGTSEVTIEEVDQTMLTVSDSVKNLGDISSQTEANSLASIFTSFMDIARNTGYLFSAINGSITFLRLIGVVTDQTQTKLDGIMSQLTIMNERLASMDAKLNEITNKMSELQASVEFNARTQQAISNRQNWHDFEYRYMESSLGKLMNTYDSVLRAGLEDWCSGSRSGTYYGVDMTNSSSGADFSNVFTNSSFYAIYGSGQTPVTQSQSGQGELNTGINYDNSYLTLLYKKNNNDYQMIYSDAAGVPSSMDEEDRWLTIPASCIPQSIAYDVNTFNEDLEEAIFNLIKAETDEGNYNVFAAHNYPLFTAEGIDEITDADIEKLAKDAVNTLVYRTASLIVNGDATFAGNVKNEFALYCNHLQSGGEGLDAVLKTFFLTHAFEYETSEDIKNFCDRMNVITGTYGVFTSNILGMSHRITDNEKLTALSQMSQAIKTIEQAKANSITGNPKYCYITGTNLAYTTVEFSGSAELRAHYTMSNTTYKSYKGTKPTAYYDYSTYDSTPIGDTAMILIVNTLLSNGINPNHAYFNEKIGRNQTSDYGLVVTGFSPSQNFTIDGSTKLHVKKAFGDYFTNNSTITSLPGSADLDDVVYRQKINGSLYDLGSKTLSSNQTLCALAVYGENHWIWTTDEGAFMGGPNTNSQFEDRYSVKETGTDTTGVFRTHYYSVDTAYNVILSMSSRKLSDSQDIYNPQTITTYGYDASIYEEEKPVIDSENTNISVNDNNLAVSFKQGKTSDCIVDINDTFNEETRAELQDENGNKLIDCVVAEGSIKVTIPKTYLDSLRGGTYNYTLCVHADKSHQYSYNIQFIIKGNSSKKYNLVNTSVR